MQALLTLDSVGSDQPEIDEVDHPIAIIASQDCDLEQDFRARANGKAAQLPSILLYEVTEAQTLLSRMAGSDIKRQASNNKNERYHVLQSVPTELDALGQRLPDLGIDFNDSYQ